MGLFWGFEENWSGYNSFTLYMGKILGHDCTRGHLNIKMSSYQYRDPHVNSLTLSRWENDFNSAILKLTSQIDILSNLHEIALGWIPQHLTDDKSTLVHVMKKQQKKPHYESTHYDVTMRIVATPTRVVRGRHLVCWRLNSSVTCGTVVPRRWTCLSVILLYSNILVHVMVWCRQAWASVDIDLCRHMASLGLNELKDKMVSWLSYL